MNLSVVLAAEQPQRCSANKRSRRQADEQTDKPDKQKDSTIIRKVAAAY